MKTLLTYLRRHHAGLLALFITLGGTSYAVATGSIDSREIRNNTIRTQDVRNHTLVGRDIRDGAVGSQDVRDGRLGGVDVANGSLSGADVANGSLAGAEIRDGSLGDRDLGSNSVSGDEIRSNAVDSDEVRNGSLRAEDLVPGLLDTNAVARFDSFPVPGGGTASDNVACASGERALGGGVSFADANAGDRVTFSAPRDGSSAPASQGAAATGWAAGILNGDAAERTATVWVLCASR
jgi:hypothetical protein